MISCNQVTRAAHRWLKRLRSRPAQTSVGGFGKHPRQEDFIRDWPLKTPGLRTVADTLTSAISFNIDSGLWDDVPAASRLPFGHLFVYEHEDEVVYGRLYASRDAAGRHDVALALLASVMGGSGSRFETWTVLDRLDRLHASIRDQDPDVAVLDMAAAETTLDAAFKQGPPPGLDDLPRPRNETWGDLRSEIETASGRLVTRCLPDEEGQPIAIIHRWQQRLREICDLSQPRWVFVSDSGSQAHVILGAQVTAESLFFLRCSHDGALPQRQTVAAVPEPPKASEPLDD